MRRWLRRPRGVARPSIQHSGTPEEVVLEAARRGDLRAWELITRRQQEVVFRAAYLTTRDSISAEQTTKLAFMRAYRSLPSLEPGAPLRPWLMSIVATVARTNLREMAQRRDTRVPDADPCPRVPATRIYLDRGVPQPTAAEREALIYAFDGMLDSERLIIASRYVFNVSRDDVAARLGCRPEAVEDHLAASIGRLRVRLAETLDKSESAVSVDRSPAKRGLQVHHVASLGDDQLGFMTMAVVLSDLRWTPDVAPAICSRLAREAAAYPEHLSVSSTAAVHDARADTAQRRPPSSTTYVNGPLDVSAFMAARGAHR